MEKVILTTFTDPMMGLSYESELIMNHLKKEYGEFIELGNKLFTACIVCEEWGEPKKYKPIIKPLDVKLYDLIIEKRQTLYKQHMEGQPPMAVSK